jgi:subtilase-type serine protease
MLTQTEIRNLGTKTAGLSTNPTDHQTTEYNSNYALNWIGAKDAYARGWTGKGAVLGVIDTWQDTDHEKLDGKYLFYHDYDPYNDTVNEGAQGHGTMVALNYCR